MSVFNAKHKVVVGGIGHLDDDGDFELPRLRKVVHLAGLSIDDAQLAIDDAYRNYHLPDVLKSEITKLPVKIDTLVSVDDKPFAPGDLVRISIDSLQSRDQRTTFDVHVDNNGDVPIMLVGPVHFAGLDHTEAARAVNRAYTKANLVKYIAAQTAKLAAWSPGKLNAGPIKVGDHLQIRLWDVGETPGEVVKQFDIPDDGTIRLPRLGPIRAIDLTEGELAKEIQSAYSDANLLQMAQVTVLRTAHLPES